MARLDRIAEARQAVREAALTRWLEREGSREQHARDLAAGGPGAADSPQRNSRLQTRETAFEQARALRRAGRLPIGIERRMGPTLDWVPFAPSEAARTAGRPVARLVQMAGPGLQPEGFATGFLVTPSLLMTNHHVFPDRASAVDTAANFGFERTDRGQQAGTLFELDPDRFFVSDERLDFAIVAVSPRSADGSGLDALGFLALIEATPKILIGQPVNVIEHPAGGPKQYAISQNRLLDILDAGFLQYETDTQEGSSGSPAFSDNWELVALHHTAIPELRDGRVVAIDGSVWEPGMPDERVHWIANEGVRVSAIVKHLSGLALPDPEQQALLTALLASTTDPADELMQGAMEGAGLPLPAQPQAAGPSVRAMEGAMPQVLLNFSGPVTINFQAAAAPVMPAPAEPARLALLAAEEASIRFDRDYAGREGYAPGFLGQDDPALHVPAPGLSATWQADAIPDRDGRPLLLRYHHFELVMSTSRRLQLWSAVNVDYDPARKTKRPGGRAGFGRDRWVPDPRIPAALQIMDAEFYKPAGNIDRGHMVRREDNAWGDSEPEIEFANSDTFHWTNCTPQHEAFNQSDPGQFNRTYRGMVGLWGDLENLVKEGLQGRSTRACLLAGPVLDEADPSADFGSGPVQYPLRFWKAVAVPGPNRGLQVFGFVLSQKPVVDRFGIEAFGPARFKRYQISLRKIESLTGVVFDPALHRADTMAGRAMAIRIDQLDQVHGLPGRTARAAPEVEPVA